jgi:uncharacterized protein (TIGR02246 family)
MEPQVTHIRRAERKLAIAAIVGLLTVGHAAPRAQPSGPQTLAHGFVRAWNAHHANAFGALFSEDADWVPASGVRVKGRAEIQSLLGREHLTWARTTTMSANEIEVRLVGQEAAVVLFTWEIVGSGDTTASRFRGNTMMVAAKRSDRWLAVAGQVARLTAP